MIEDVLVIDGHPCTWEEALEMTHKALFQAGYVKDTFLQGCVERERIFPTGLLTEIPVAIPHTDAKHVNIPAVCLLRLAKPVVFQDMGEPEQSVEAEYVFNMALQSNDDQLSMLQAILQVAQDADFLLNAKHMSLSTIRQTLRTCWHCGER